MSAAGEVTTGPLGATGLTISKLGLGAWAIGGASVVGLGPQDDDESIAAIEHAIACGVNWIDTAPVYGLGHSELLVGRVVARLPAADRPFVFTKCGIVWDEAGEILITGRPEAIRQGAEESLRRLGVETLDLLQLHWPPRDGTPLELAWTTLVELREEGVARNVGVSNCTVAQLGDLQRIGPIDTVQPRLSIIASEAREDGTLAWCEEHGAGAIVYSPLQSGLLAGKLTRERVAAFDPDDTRLNYPEFAEPALTRNLALVERLRELAAELGCSVAELAIAWTLHQRGVSGAIVGARRPSQVDGWIGAGEVALDAETLARIDGS